MNTNLWIHSNCTTMVHHMFLIRLHCYEHGMSLLCEYDVLHLYVQYNTINTLYCNEHLPKNVTQTKKNNYVQYHKFNIYYIIYTTPPTICHTSHKTTYHMTHTIYRMTHTIPHEIHYISHDTYHTTWNTLYTT